MSNAHVEDHSSLIKTPKQLVIVVVLAFLIPVIGLVMLARLMSGGIDTSKNNPAMAEEAVASRIKPVGEVALASAGGNGKTDKSGKEVVDAVCAACHGAGVLGAPKIGDKAAWGKLIARGLSNLAQSAVKGVRQMPARGGNSELSDIEIERAIVYMANQSGGHWVEPLATAKAPGKAGNGERSGEQIVQAVCSKCHQTGEGGAPKIGDKPAWLPRVSHGLDAVTKSAIKGHGGMPARGGMADLTDSELRRAVEYMFLQGGGGATAPAAAPVKAADGNKGKTVYDTTCAACHAAGVAGAPKAGDKAAWAPRIKTGTNALYGAALKGKNAMPPKGGNASLTDADVKAAVDYLVGLAK